MAEIIVACFTVLALPIAMNVAQLAPEDAVSGTIEDAESVRRPVPEFDPGSAQANEYIDYVIDEAFAQVAR